MRVSDGKQQWREEYYHHIDATDHDPSMTIFAGNARMLSASAGPAKASPGIRGALTGRLGSIDGIQHIPHDACEEAGALMIFECDVVCTCKDGKRVTVRSGCLFAVGDDGLCREQRTTADTTPVFAA